MGQLNTLKIYMKYAENGEFKKNYTHPDKQLSSQHFRIKL